MNLMQPPLPGFDGQLSWLSVRAQLHEGALGDLARCLPSFARQPFEFGELINPRADLIVREPKHKGERPVPVAMVSKGYVLVQHLDLFQQLQKSLVTLNALPDTINGRLILTEYGERMYLRLVVPQLRRFIGNDVPVDLQVHCLNSVDKSVALQVRLGWYWSICSNGLFLGREMASVRLPHVYPLQADDVGWMLGDQMDQLDQAQAQLSDWIANAITLEAVLDWADRLLARRWGVYLAARVCHIARTGKDGKVVPVARKTKPSEYAVIEERQSPARRRRQRTPST